MPKVIVIRHEISTEKLTLLKSAGLLGCPPQAAHDVRTVRAGPRAMGGRWKDWEDRSKLPCYQSSKVELVSFEILFGTGKRSHCPISNGVFGQGPNVGLRAFQEVLCQKKRLVYRRLRGSFSSLMISRCQLVIIRRGGGIVEAFAQNVWRKKGNVSDVDVYIQRFAPPVSCEMDMSTSQFRNSSLWSLLRLLERYRMI